MMTAATTRKYLFRDGVELVKRFCERNDLETPEVRPTKPQRWRFSACAYYRPTYIAIAIERCAAPGHGGRAWSWPGYVIDRTPYGVLAHELGHHVDYSLSREKGAYYGDFSKELRASTQEKAITSYCPNDAEWFAEIFRLFVTNPDLLDSYRPKTYKALRERFTPVVLDPWDVVLKKAPQRTIAQAQKKIRSVEV